MPEIVGSLKPPRLASAPASPGLGQMYYDTALNQLLYWNGTTWVAGGASTGTSYTQVIGDGTSQTFTITHNLGVRGVTVAVYRSSAPFDEVEVEVEHTSVNTATVRTVTVPTSGQYTVAVMSGGGSPGPTGATGAGVPVGGTTGQVLAKRSATDLDTQWVTSGGASVTPARAYYNSAMALVSGSWTRLPLNTISFDDGAYFDLANSRYVVPVAGYYLVTSMVALVDNNSVAVDAQGYIGIFQGPAGSTSLKAYGTQLTRAGPSGYGGLNASDILKCVVGDTLEIYAQMTSALPRIRFFSPQGNFMSVVKVG